MEQHIGIEILRRWRNVENLDDFTSLLNLINSNLPFKKELYFYPVTLISLSNIYNKNRFRSFDLKTKKKTRTIAAPNGIEFKQLLRCIAILLDLLYIPHASAKGYIKGLSIKDNAIDHSAKKYVFNTDIVSFFDKIHQKEFIHFVEKLNVYPQNSFTSFLLQNIIANLCFHIKDGEIVLPQGAPTSPVISNIVCLSLDDDLSKLADKNSMHYTRYADDITFSSNHNHFDSNGKFRQELNQILKYHQFDINVSKTRLQFANQRQMVTGLVVNKKPNVPRTYIKQLRMLIYYWETYGEAKAMKLFVNYTLTKKANKKNYKRVAFSNIIDGKLCYLKMIRGEDDSTYLKLRARYFRLQKPNLL